MKNLVLFCWILQIGCTFSQIRVVRDPLACAYGLQNQKNEWIVPPNFQQLLYLNDGFYACQSNEKWGLLKENGRQVSEAVHDQINIFKPGQFLIVDVIQKEGYTYKKMGVLDTNLRWIIPQEYTSISRMEKNHFLLTKSSYDTDRRLQNYSSICDENGQLLFSFQEGYILNTFYLKDLLLIGNTLIGSQTVYGNVRGINLKGEIVTDTTYDYAMPCTEAYIIVKINNKSGLLNAEGKTIIPPKYIFEGSYDYQNPIPCLHGHHLLTFIENGKKGLLNGKWEVVLPPNYQSIQAINTNASSYTSARFIAYDNAVLKYHLLDEKGKLLHLADTITTKLISLPKLNYYELDKYIVFYFFGNRNGNSMKWGILNNEGKILLPGLYESLLITPNFDAIQIKTRFDASLPPYISKMNLIDSSQSSLENLEFAGKVDSIYLYTLGDNYYPFLYQPSINKWSNELYGYNLPYKYGDYIIISGNSNAFLIHKKLKTIQKFKIIDIHNGHFPIVYSQEGMNILHPKKGLLFAQNQLQINQQFTSINRIWVRNNNGLWSIYDTLANKRIAEDFDEIAYYWESMIVKKNGQYGILNKECQWYTPPVFKDIFQLTENGFVGLTHTGKVGVINTNSQEKVDTSFHSFIPMSYYSTKQLKYCLIKNQQKYFFDENHQLLPLTEKEIITKSWTNPSEPCYSFYINPLQNNTSYLSNCEDKLYNILYPFYQLNLKNDKNVVLDGKRGQSNNENYNFELTYLNASKFSIHIFKYQQNHLDNFEKNHVEPIYDSDLSLHDNWLLINGEWKEVKYDHLFNPLDPLFQKAIISAIQQNSALKIDCRDPSYLFKGATQFSFEAEGIKLYFFQDQHDAFTLTLNLKELARIPSAKWVVKYF